MRDELRLAIDAAREAGVRILAHYGGAYAVRDKVSGSRGPAGVDELRAADYDPVTSADLEADACLRQILHGTYPEYGWLSEETADSPERLERHSVWIVDPIDGTKEFVSHIPEFGISVALVQAGEPVVGVIHNPASGELFSAVKGGGAFLNGRRVFCTETAELASASLIVSRSEDARGEVAPLRPHLGQVRAVGSVAYKLAAVAAGHADLNVSVQPKNEWDVCAGDLLVREAGGQMLDLAGRVRRYNQRNPLIEGGLVAGNAELSEQMLALVARLYR
ncbi:MAG: 3'(2'),5'-bisphosphate nucleotidase CysQ [Gemmatimonadota bacterium]